MSTNTTRKTVAGAFAEIAVLRTEIAATRSDMNAGFERIEALFAQNRAAEPAKTATPAVTPAPEAPVQDAPRLKTLTRSEAARIKTLKSGKKYAGMTRPEMLAAGLKGYALPSGAARDAIKAYNA